MNLFEAWITKQRRRLSFGVFLTAFTDAMALFLLAFGSAVLIVKLARPGMWPGVLWLAALAVPLTTWAWWRSRRRAFSRSQAVALLDSQTGASGLLMTLCETTERDAASGDLRRKWLGRAVGRLESELAGRPSATPSRACRPAALAAGPVCHRLLLCAPA